MNINNNFNSPVHLIIKSLTEVSARLAVLAHLADLLNKTFTLLSKPHKK